MTDEENLQQPKREWRPDPNEVAFLAYRYYEERGRDDGQHDEDWYRAENELHRRRRDGRTVVGVFHSTDNAQQAVEQLQREGFDRHQINFIANNVSTQIAADAGIGAALGGVGGLLLGFAGLAVPGIGPVLAAGPIVAALGGAGIGAAAGGLIGALTESGVPENVAQQYAEGLRRGDVLLTVRAEGERADRALEIMDRQGAVDIDSRVNAWRTRGWTGYDPGAAPFTADELRREREYLSAADRQGNEWERRSQAGAQPSRASRVYPLV